MGAVFALLVAWTVTWSTIAPTAAHAIDAAEAAYKTGMELAAQRDVRGARALFERAWALTPQWRFAFNVARTAALDGDLVGAERWIWRAEGAAATDAERAKTVAERTVVEKQLLSEGYGRLRVSVVGVAGKPVVTVDGGPADRRDAVWVVWTKAGRRQVRVDVAGCRGFARELLIVERELRDLECDPCETTAPGHEVGRPAEVDVTVRQPLTPQPKVMPPSRTPLWVGVAGGALALVGGALMGGAAQGSGQDNAAYRAGTIDKSTYAELRSGTETLYGVGAGSAAVGVIVAGIGLWLHVTQPATAEPPPTALAPIEPELLHRLAASSFAHGRN